MGNREATRRGDDPERTGPTQIRETFLRTGTNGVAVLDGYGASLTVDKGHLTARDGIGPHRREQRWPRVGHGLSRVVILGRTQISTEALKWCRDGGVAVLVLDPWKLKVLASSATEPGRDGRLRRAQAVMGLDEPGLVLARELIGAKLRAQAATIREHQLDGPADEINNLARAAANAPSVEAVRQAEAAGGNLYWNTWNGRSMTFAARDRSRIPDRWQAFGTRRSLYSETGNRYATDPTNAILNYLYRLLEVETRSAVLAMGLDPLLGVIHADERDRDSLVLDLMEPVRPKVDQWVLNRLSEHTFRKTDFHERADGTVSIVAPLSHQLAETMPMWAGEVAPWAERAARVFADASPYPIPTPTRLTQSNRRKGQTRTVSVPSLLGRNWIECGGSVVGRRRLCDECLPLAKARSAEQARRRSSQATVRRRARNEQQPTWAASVNASRAETMRRQRAERDAWEAAHQGETWDSAAFEPVRRALAEVPMSAVMQATGMSRGACAAIRSGRQTCHPRHWEVLARLAGMSLPERPSQSKRVTDLMNGAD
jgi:CRISPR-associated endonuclease Cas1